MTSFINPGYSSSHNGAARLENATAAVGQVGSQFKGAKGLVALLLASVISAMVVVADQILSSWTDGHLLMAWVALWVMVFAALALFAEASRGWTAGAIAAVEAWSKAADQRASDERVWAVALADPRLMSELQTARLRAERDALAAGEALPSWPFAQSPTHNFNFAPRLWF